MQAQTIPLTLRYFAILREQRGVDRESVETAQTTPGALYAELAGKYAFTLPVDAIRVAVNDCFVAMDTALRPQDTVVFIPPVAGG